MEIDRGILRIIRRWGVRRAIAPLKTLLTGPRVERAVDGEMLVGQQACRLRLRADRSEKPVATSPSNSRSRFFENEL
jgi:hypothetical protein